MLAAGRQASITEGEVQILMCASVKAPDQYINSPEFEVRILRCAVGSALDRLSQTKRAEVDVRMLVYAGLGCDQIQPEHLCYCTKDFIST